MLWDYVKEVFSAAFSGTEEWITIIEIISTLGIFFLPKLFRLSKVNGHEKSLRKRFFRKFFSDAKWRGAVVILLLFTFHFFVIAPFQAYKKVAGSNGWNHDISYKSLTNELSLVRGDLKNEKIKADDYKRRWLNALTATGSQNHSSEIDSAIKIVKREQSESPTNHESLQSVLQNARDLKSLEDQKRIEDKKRAILPVYKIWEYAISTIQTQLSQVTNKCGPVHIDDLPTIDELAKGENKSVQIRLGTNCAWKCQCEFRGTRPILLDLNCQSEGAQTVRLILRLEGDLFLASLTIQGEPAIVKSCPISETSDCIAQVDFLTNLLMEDQKEEFR